MSSVLPYSLPLSGGVFALSQKHWRTVLGRHRYFRCSRRRCHTVASTVTIRNAHVWSTCGTKTCRNEQLTSDERNFHSINCLHECAVMRWETKKSTHTGKINWTSNVPHLSEDGRVFRTASTPSRYKALLCPKLKNISRMKDIILELSLPNDLVVECCDGTFSVAKAFMLLPRHRQFVGCYLDLEWVAFHHSKLALIFSRQVLNK